MKKLSKINESVFADIIRRSASSVIKKEDEVRLKEFIESRENPEDYYIEDNLVCCRGDVIIEDNDLVSGKFPVKFGSVDKNFDCSCCPSLTSLEGAPEKVGGSFDCSNCPIESYDINTIIKGKLFK